MMRALWSDTAFLAGLGVMDYSLLVGMDKTSGTLVIGIIDFIRQVCSVRRCCCTHKLCLALPPCELLFSATSGRSASYEYHRVLGWCSTPGTRRWSVGSSLAWA